MLRLQSIFKLFLALFSLALLTSSCAIPHDGSAPQSEVDFPMPAPTAMPGLGQTDALIFKGPSAWPAEVKSIESILYHHDFTYQEMSSETLDSLPFVKLTQYRLIIVPGGNAEMMTQSLSSETHQRLRNAVQNAGMGYLGFCAGAWIAIAPAPTAGQDVSYGIGVVNGPLEEQTYLYKQGLHFGLSNAIFPDGSRQDLLWYGGPVTPNLPSGVIAKYADGTPAITQLRSGKGFVIVSGLHTAATQPMLNSLGIVSQQAIAPDFTLKMISATISQIPLPAFP